MIKKAILIGVFLTIPAMALMAYAVYWARNYIQTTWGVEIGPILYNAMLAVAFALAIWLTAGKFLRQLAAEAGRKQKQDKFD